MMPVVATAPDRPAANANGTVRPSDIPITMSRTVSLAVKCFSMCGVAGIIVSSHGTGFDFARSNPTAIPMEVLVINQTEVARLLPMRECIEVMAEALAALARGEAVLPLRLMLMLPDRRGALAAMPSYLRGLDEMAVKVISVIPGNLGTPYDSHQGAVLLFEAQHGCLLAILDASEVTAIRTAAVSAVATRLLSRPDAHNLAILGSGVQARTHLESMLLVRPVKRVRVWSRNADHAQRFAAREAKRHGLAIEAVPTAQDAVRGADLICTTTAAREPVLCGEWLAPGAHINAVGASTPDARELDTAAVARSRLFVDRRESALKEAGDFLIPKREGAIGDDHIRGELGDVLLGTVAGRTAPGDIALFKSLGIAVEDLAAAHHIYQRTREMGAGTRVELGGQREDGKGDR